MGIIIIIIVCFILPIVGLIKLSKTTKNTFKMAIAGALTFYISQGMLRIPLLNSLMDNVEIQAFLYTNIFINLLLYSFSAGVFEEIGRFIAFKITKAITLKEALAFGIGHGAFEAILLVGLPALSQSIDLTSSILASGERLAAMGMHIALSVLVLTGITKKQGVLWCMLAIMIHGIFNLIPSYIATYFYSPFIISIVIYVLAIMIILFVFKYLVKENV